MSLSDTLYSADQVKSIEQYAINKCGIASFTLMQDAGQAAFNALIKRYPNCDSICVVCGTGNNGGDGYIVARLALESKLKVTVIQLGDNDSISGDALKAKQEYESQTGAVTILEPCEANSTNEEVEEVKAHKSGGVSFNFDNSLLDVDVIVDAIFGTGLNRDISGTYLSAIKSINNKLLESPHTKIMSLDIPSGLSADSGTVFGKCIKADTTVTFVGLKRGLYTGQANEYVGEINFDDLSIPLGAYQQLEIKHPINIITDDILQKILTPRPRYSHKGHFGHVLLIGSDEGMTGAIRIAAEACLRCGAGLVTVATHPSHASTINLGRPEIMVHGIGQTAALKPLIDKATVIVLGPGLGLSEWSKSLFFETIKSSLPTVIDADALNLLAENENDINPKENWILTPHPKEMSRLLKKTTAEIESDRFKSNVECVLKKTFSTDENASPDTRLEQSETQANNDVEPKPNKSGGVSILKGAGTLISDKHQTLVCKKGNPGMSSGGMGDALSGVIAAMLAQGLSLFDAASVGVYLHSFAADLAAKDGEKGLLASDLFPHLRALVNNLSLHKA